MSWLENPDLIFDEDDERETLAPAPINADFELNLPKGYLSFSQISKYMNCPEQYYHQYVLGKRAPGSSNMAQGRLIHQALEAMHKYKMENNQAMPPPEYHHDLLSDAIDGCFEEVEMWDEKTPDKDTAEKFSRKLSDIYYKERLPDVRVRDAERKVEGLIAGIVPVLGYVDLIEIGPMDTTDPDDIFTDPFEPQPTDAIVDAKTTGRKYPKGQVENSLQLTMYADLLGVENVGFDLLVQTAKGKTSYYKQRGVRSMADKMHAREVIVGIAKAISAGIFPKASPEHWMCSKTWCPVWDDCRGKYAKSTT